MLSIYLLLCSGLQKENVPFSGIGFSKLIFLANFFSESTGNLLDSTGDAPRAVQKGDVHEVVLAWWDRDVINRPQFVFRQVEPPTKYVLAQ